MNDTYVSRDGEQYGPYSIEDISQYVTEGRFASTDHAWKEGMSEWVALHTMLPNTPPPPTKSKGIKRKHTDHPIKKKKVMDRISDLPTPLKVATWANIVLIAISLVEGLASMTSVPLARNIENAYGVLLSAIIVIGILQASRLTRIIALILSWISVIIFGIGIPLGMRTILDLIPFSVDAITIWGLSARRSKAYFGY